MIATPVLTPVTIPEAEPTETKPVYPGLLQVPPVAVSVIVVDAPTHTVAAPVIKAGDAFTVTVAYAAQPVSKE